MMGLVAEGCALLLYYAVFVPLAIVCRWFLRDPLRLDANRESASLWIDRSTAEYGPMTRPY
jgi:hypothetical protein